MPYVYEINEEGRRVEVRFTGEITLQERLEASRAVLSCATRNGLHRVLVDFRRANSLGSEHDASVELAAFIARSQPSPSARVAYLVIHDHQLDDTVERLAAERGLRSRRFLDPASAAAWLDAAGDDPEDPDGREVAPRAPGIAGEPGTNWATWID